MRGTLTILVLAGAIAVGLWYWLTPADTPGVTQPETAGPTGDATSATGHAQTADSGAEPAAEVAGSTDAASPSGVTPTADSGATPRTGDTHAADSDTASPGDAVRPTTDPGATESVRQTAAVEQKDPAAARELILSPAPEATVEQVPIAAPATDEPGQADLLAAVERAIEQVDTAIRERIVPESEVDTDTKRHGQAEHDDSQGDVAQADGERNEAAPTADAALRADVARTAESEATAAEMAAPEMAEAEAKQYVETLTEASPRTIPVDQADHFVTPEHTLSLVPEDAIERVSVGELARDDTLAAQTPITVVREVEQRIEAAVPEQLIAESGGDLDARLSVLVRYEGTPDDAEENVDAERNVAVQGDAEQDDTGQKVAAAQPEAVEEITVREALERLLAEPEEPISIIKTTRYFEVMTLKELLDAEEGADTFLNVVTRPYRIEAATLADLLQRQKVENPGSIFYLHTVQPTDEQGIWGIVHSGLIDNFARGVAVERGEAVETYKVQIPRDADERLEDQSSSYLGKLIDRKTKESFVYNYRDDRMGRNPDRIHPGQEIVIINFEPEELVSIYRHFASG